MPTLPRSIALHIGAHKTASSHLQNMLYRNRKMISDEGIRVYGPGYLRLKGRNLAAMFGMSWSESPSPRRDPHQQLEFLSKGRKRLVFTEENFAGSLVDSAGNIPLPIYPFGADRVAELVAAFAPVQTQLFLAVRNPATFLASAYSQTLLGGVHIGARSFRARNDWRLVDWADYVQQLRDVADLTDIYVWRQEDYDLSQRVILRCLLSPKLGEQVQSVAERVHRGLSVAAVRQTLKWAKERRTGQLARDARRTFPVGPEHKSFRLYSSATLKEAQACYDRQMARIEQIEGVTILRPPAGALEG